MKKTERIELRVDHAEKERLSAIAERRGHTVSDVVRDALAGELGVVRATYPKWPGRVAIGAAALSLVTLGLFAMGAHNADKNSVDPVYQDIVSADLIMGDESVSFDISTHTASKHEVSIKSQERETVQLIITATPDPESNLLTLKSDACIVRDQSCDALDLQTISVNTRPSRSGRASISTTFGDSSLYISFNTQTYWPKPDIS